jgi:hypothetical protein
LPNGGKGRSSSTSCHRKDRENRKKRKSKTKSGSGGGDGVSSQITGNQQILPFLSKELSAIKLKLYGPLYELDPLFFSPSKDLLV